MSRGLKRVDPKVLRRIAEDAERQQARYGKVTAIVWAWSEKLGRDERQVWRYLAAGRRLLLLFRRNGAKPG